jgi:sigma-B regulation protein RsbU (phosphoserine phosphatase)
MLAVVGDVSGKGISSALYAVKAQTAMQLFADETPEPRALLTHMNRHLYHNMKRGYFLTMAMARLHPNGAVQFCRAGHPPGLLFRPATGEVRLLQAPGVAIGITPTGANGSAEDRARSFEEIAAMEEVRMERGDLLLLYSDGLVEAVDRSGREFGVDRLSAALRTFHAEPLEVLRDRIAHSLESFRDGMELRDDTTLIMLRRTE